MSLYKDTTRTVMVFMTDENDRVTGKTGLTLTITLSKAGAAFATITPTVTERGNGWYALDLTTSHTDTLGDLALHITASGADPTDRLLQIVPALVDGRVDVNVGAMSADVVTASAIATDAIGSAELAASAVTKIQTGLPSATDYTSARATKLDHLDVDVSTRAAPGAAMDLIDDAVDAGAVAASGAAEIQSGLATSSGQTSILSAIAGVQSDTDNIQTRLPAALVGGRMDADVGHMQADVVDATALAASAATEVANAVGAPSAAAVAAAVWDLATAGHATAGSFGARVDAAISSRAAPGDQMSLTVAIMNTLVDLVWDEIQSGHSTSGTFGKFLDTLVSSRADGADYTTARAAKLDNLDATVSSRAAPGAAMTLAADAVDASALATSAVQEIANGLLDLANGVGSKTLREVLSWMAAVLLGKCSGMSTTTNTFRDIDDTKDAIIATTDSNDNRLTVVRS